MTAVMVPVAGGMKRGDSLATGTQVRMGPRLSNDAQLQNALKSDAAAGRVEMDLVYTKGRDEANAAAGGGGGAGGAGGGGGGATLSSGERRRGDDDNTSNADGSADGEVTSQHNRSRSGSRPGSASGGSTRSPSCHSQDSLDLQQRTSIKSHTAPGNHPVVHGKSGTSAGGANTQSDQQHAAAVPGTLGYNGVSFFGAEAMALMNDSKADMVTKKEVEGWILEMAESDPSFRRTLMTMYHANPPRDKKK